MSVLTFATAGDFTWIVPIGTKTVTVECWGGGGGGGPANASFNGAGGGGGAYSRSVLSVTFSEMYNLHVGAAGPSGSGAGEDSLFKDAVQVVIVKAVGGTSGTLNGSGGSGGLAANCTGTTKFSGGNGGAACGSGGGGAGSAGNGNNGATSGGVVAGGNGGTPDGGKGASNNCGSGGAAVQPGGGGGGANHGACGDVAAPGAVGTIKLTFTVQAPGGVNVIRLPRRGKTKTIRAKGKRTKRMSAQKKVPGTFDHVHMLPPDKLSKLTETIFAKYNSGFKVVAVKRQLNGQYNVGVELQSGSHKMLVI